MGPTYVEANLMARREQQFRLQFHQRRLEEIKKRGNRSVMGRMSVEARGGHSKNVSLYSDRSFDIEQGNKLLIAKLVRIAKRKPQWENLHNGSPTSLNIRLRKQQFDQITAANHQFAQRIFNINSFFTSKSLERRSQDLQRYKEISSRMRLVEVVNKANKGLKLPGVHPSGKSLSPSPGNSVAGKQRFSGGLRRVTTDRVRQSDSKASISFPSPTTIKASNSEVMKTTEQPREGSDLILV